eukprot:1084508-Rhodomonas_salina.1
MPAAMITGIVQRLVCFALYCAVAPRDRRLFEFKFKFTFDDTGKLKLSLGTVTVTLVLVLLVVLASRGSSTGQLGQIDGYPPDSDLTGQIAATIQSRRGPETMMQDTPRSTSPALSSSAAAASDSASSVLGERNCDENERIAVCVEHEHVTKHSKIGDGTEPFNPECASGRKNVGTEATALEAGMARESSTCLRQKTGESKGGLAHLEIEAACRLLALPPALIGYVWPAKRCVVGLRVCKQLRKDLVEHCRRIDLVQQPGVGAELDVLRCTEDFRRLPQHLKVMLRWRTRDDGASQLVSVLGECNGLVHLDLSENVIGDEGAGLLSGVLGKWRDTLAHVDLSHNVIFAPGAGRVAGVLGTCNALAYLDLGHNVIGAEGVG